MYRDIIIYLGLPNLTTCLLLLFPCSPARSCSQIDLLKRVVTVPEALKWYAKDFYADSKHDAIYNALEYGSAELGRKIAQISDSSHAKPPSIRYEPYVWEFRTSLRGK